MKKLLPLLAALMLTACSPSGGTKPITYRRITADEAAVMMAQETGYIILDVRRPDEFARSRIAGATLLNVLDTTGFCRGIDTLSRKPHYYLYCLKGLRRLRAARIMQERGFHVTSLDGGIDAWQQAGLSVDSALLDK